MLGSLTPSAASGFISEEVEALGELVAFLSSFPPVLMAIFIYIKNTSALVLSFILSPVLCFTPIMTLITNGWLLAFVSTVVIEEESLGYLLAGLLPHGIFELPAIIIGEAAALSFGTMVMLALIKKDRRNLLLPNLKKNLKYLALAFALLLPAAIIETFVTPLLLG